MVFLWWCFFGGVFVVFLCWCFCGGVFVAFLWWFFCGGVFVVVFLWCCKMCAGFRSPPLRCYSGAFWNRAICKNFEERRKPQQVTTKNHKILQQSQNPTKILTNLLVGHQTFAELVKNQKTNNKNHHPNWTQGSWSIVRVMLFLG